MLMAIYVDDSSCCILCGGLHCHSARIVNYAVGVFGAKGRVLFLTDRSTHSANYSPNSVIVALLALRCGRCAATARLWVFVENILLTSRVFNRPEFSGRHDFQAKKFGRQCAKSGSHAVGLQEKSSKNLMQNNTYYICVTYAPPT